MEFKFDQNVIPVIKSLAIKPGKQLNKMPTSPLRNHTIVLISLIGLIFLPATAKSDYSSANGMTTASPKYYYLENGLVLHDNCQDGAKLIEKMIGAAARMNEYSATYHMKVYKSNGQIQETGTMYFRKPRLFRVEVTSGPKEGALALLASDGKVHGHMGGIMKFFHGTVSADSSMARAINGFPMAGTDFYSLVDYLKNRLKEGTESRQTNEPMRTAQTNGLNYILDMYVVDRSTKTPLLLKRIFVDPNTYLPVFWQDYAEGKLCSESDWHNVRDNLALPNTLFEP